MTFSLFKWVRRHDSLGHPINVYFQGSSSYRTTFGALCSVTVKVLVLILVIQSVQELIFMNSPVVLSTSHPISIEDRTSFTPVEFDKYDFVLALEILKQDKNGNQSYE